MKQGRNRTNVVENKEEIHSLTDSEQGNNTNKIFFLILHNFYILSNPILLDDLIANGLCLLSCVVRYQYYIFYSRKLQGQESMVLSGLESIFRKSVINDRT